eukprot:1228186-Rhodomonas_salina.1
MVVLGAIQVATYTRASADHTLPQITEGLLYATELEKHHSIPGWALQDRMCEPHGCPYMVGIPLHTLSPNIAQLSISAEPSTWTDEDSAAFMSLPGGAVSLAGSEQSQAQMIEWVRHANFHGSQWTVLQQDVRAGSRKLLTQLSLAAIGEREIAHVCKPPKIGRAYKASPWMATD